MARKKDQSRQTVLGADIRFEPRERKGRVAICAVFIDGVYGFDEITHWPRPFDFVSRPRTRYAIRPTDMRREDWLVIGATPESLTENEYAEDGEELYWCTVEDLDEAVRLELELRTRDYLKERQSDVGTSSGGGRGVQRADDG